MSEIPLHDLPPRQAVERYRAQELQAARAAPQLLSDRAGADGNARLAYAGRFAFELLQNACDAHERQWDLHEQDRAPPPGRAQARVLLTGTHIFVANTGYPFSFKPLWPGVKSGIEALCRYGASSKGPARCAHEDQPGGGVEPGGGRRQRAYKGQFGIGFKSVDEVADEVLISSGRQRRYRLRFCRERLLRALGPGFTGRLPLLYAPEWFDDGPPEIAELEACYDTVIALRLREPGDLQDVRDRLEEVGPEEMLLLETLWRLEIEDRSPGGSLSQRYELKRLEMGPPEIWRVQPREDPALRYALFRAPIDGGPQDHRIAWPLGPGDEPRPRDGGSFMSFYPISSEANDAPFIVHSYFVLDSNRKSFAEQARDRARNETLMGGVLDLLEASLPALRGMPRTDPLHVLVWPAHRPELRAGATTFFHEELRRRAWGWEVFERHDGSLRAGAELRWPPPGLGLDPALEHSSSAAPFARRCDPVQPRPEGHLPLQPAQVACWLVDSPPTLPEPRSFACLLLALDELVQEDRSSFAAVVRSAPLLPVVEGGGWTRVGQSDHTQVYLASDRELRIDPELEGLLRIRLLHPAALNEGPRGSATAVRELFDVRELDRDELVRGLERAVAGRTVDTPVALAILRTVVAALRPRLEALGASPDPLKPWFFTDQRGPPLRTRIRMAQLPLPLARGTPVAAGALCLEANSGQLARLYPPRSGQRFLNPETEHPEARQLLDAVRPAGQEAWPFRQRVYAYLGAWPMPRLHAFYGGRNGASASSSPHPSVSDEAWRRYLHGVRSRWSIHKARVFRSLCWPHFAEQARWCAEQGLLPELLAEVLRHRDTLASGRWAHIRSSKGNHYPHALLHWQLRDTSWLPAIRVDGDERAFAPDEVWWTRDRLAEQRLRGSQWGHLPTLHAGRCPAWLADRLQLCDYDEPRSPDRQRSKARTLAALRSLGARAATHDGPGLRKLYRRLTTRLASLDPGPGELDTILAVTGSGPALAVPPREAWIEDLPLPLPLGRDQLAIALLGPRTGRLARALGIQSLKGARIRYYAPDLNETSQVEQTLTRGLARLIPVAFAIRAHSRRIDENQRLDLSKAENLAAVQRALLAVVEVVEAVSIFVDDNERPLATQGPRQPVVVAHRLDLERGTIPVFFSKRQVRACQHDAARLLPLLAPVAASLAGNVEIADSLELLVREDSSLDDASVERFLAQRHGIPDRDLAEVRRACGLDTPAREELRAAALERAGREAWRARCAALCRPLLARLHQLGVEASLARVAARLEGLRDHEDPLAAARRAFVPQGVAADDPLWDIATSAEASAFLDAEPELRGALAEAISTAEAERAQREEARRAVDRARAYVLAFALQQAPGLELGGLLAQWDLVVDGLDLLGPEPVREAVAGFLVWLGTEGDERVRLLDPPRRWWDPQHLEAIGLDAERVLGLHDAIRRHESSEDEVVSKREASYATWIRLRRLHETVVPRTLELEVRQPPPPIQEGAAIMDLRLESRGGPRKHGRQHRRNALTGGLGEVFVLLQEIERWRQLPDPQLQGLLDEVGSLFGADAAAQQLVAAARDRSSETWQRRIGQLLRIGDLKGSRCDLLGARETLKGARLIFVEVKATASARMDRFFLSAAEWSFLSRPDVRGRSALVLVTRAAAGRTPSVERLEDPALLVKAGKLGWSASVLELRPHRKR